LEIMVFLVFYPFLGLHSASIITLVHFIPSIDYLMLKVDIKGRMHKQLFHNIFIVAIVGILLYLFLGIMAAILGVLNVIFHFILDLNGNGIAVFFPLSKYRLRLKRQ